MIKLNDKVRLNAGVRNLHVQLRARYREGLEGTVTKVVDRTRLEVTIEDAGTVNVARIWVDKIG